MKCTPKPKSKLAKTVCLLSTAHKSAITITPNNPSELPRVLIVATIGFNSQILAYLNRDFSLIAGNSVRRTSNKSHPVTKSAIANKTFPKENQSQFGSHAVGIKNQAKRGV